MSVIGVRVPRWVKRVLEEHGVNISEYVREILVKRAEQLRGRGCGVCSGRLRRR